MTIFARQLLQIIGKQDDIQYCNTSDHVSRKQSNVLEIFDNIEMIAIYKADVLAPNCHSL